MLSRDQAIEAARRELSRNGFDPDQHDVSIDEFGREKKEWIVWFDLKGPFPIPGGKHGVVVDKVTGATRFMKGE